MHFILAKHFLDKPTGGPLWYWAWENPFCLPCPYLCAHLLASKAKWVHVIRSWGEGKAREEHIGLCSAKWSGGHWKKWSDLEVPRPRALLVEHGNVWGLAHDTEHHRELLDVCICVFNVCVWQPDMGCDRNWQRSMWQAAIFHLFSVRWGCNLSLLWDLASFNEW